MTKIRPNDPCPCGNRKPDGFPLKYKKCCRDRLTRLSVEDVMYLNEREHARAKAEYERFVESHKQGHCYVCGALYTEVDFSVPCLHWLLRPSGIKKDHIGLALNSFGLFRTEAYLRWMANTEVFAKNINNLSGEGDQSKLMDITIKYQNLEWAFSCGIGDFQGHPTGQYGTEPHFHFQMRIDGLSFINYREFHSKLTSVDIFKMKVIHGQIPQFRHANSFGAGMEEAMNVFSQENNPLDSLSVGGDESKALFGMETSVMDTSGKGISGDVVNELIEESRRTGVPMAKLLRRLSGVSISTCITPPDNVPDKASRTKRDR